MKDTEIIAYIFRITACCFILIALPTVKGLEITIAVIFLTLASDFWHHNK